jgi:hypothetical protein
MVHAPNRNDVVKVSTIWWSQFFGATRVVDAVPVAVDPEPSPRPGPAPTRPPTQGSTDPPSTPAPVPTTPGPGPTTPGPEPTDPPDGEPTTPAPETTTVPDLTGLSAADAIAALNQAGLAARAGDPVPDSPCEGSEVVVDQEPEPGAVVEVDTPVTYHLCGVPPSPTPDPSPESPPPESPEATATPTDTATAFPTAS